MFHAWTYTRVPEVLGTLPLTGAEYLGRPPLLPTKTPPFRCLLLPLPLLLLQLLFLLRLLLRFPLHPLLKTRTNATSSDEANIRVAEATPEVTEERHCWISRIRTENQSYSHNQVINLLDGEMFSLKTIDANLVRKSFCPIRFAISLFGQSCSI